MNIAEEDMNLLREAIAKVAKSTLGNITRKQTNWMTSLSAQVTRLEEYVIEVCNTMQDETYGVDPLDTLVTLMVLPPLRIEIPTHAFSIDATKTDASVHILDTLTLDFSKIILPQIYSIQHAAANVTSIVGYSQLSNF